MTLTGIVLLAPVFLANANAEGGSSTAGNGAICQNPKINQGRPILTDLAQHRPPFDDPGPAIPSLSESMSPAGQRLSYDIANIPETQAYQDALSRLRLWQEESPGSRQAMKRLEMELERISFLKVNGVFNGTVRASIPPNLKHCKGGNSRSLGLFRSEIQSEVGRTIVSDSVIVSIPDWNSLGAASQTTALIHFALRAVQLSEHENGSDSDLGPIAAKIAMEKPDPSYSFDTHPFFSPDFSEMDPIEKAALKKLCSRIGSLKKVSGLISNAEEIEAIRKKACRGDPMITENIKHLNKPLIDAILCAVDRDDQSNIETLRQVNASIFIYLMVRAPHEIIKAGHELEKVTAILQRDDKSLARDSPRKSMERVFQWYNRYLADPALVDQDVRELGTALDQTIESTRSVRDQVTSSSHKH